MKTGKQIQRTKTTVGLNVRLGLKIGIIVAAVVGCLLAVPLTRDHKHMYWEQQNPPYSEPAAQFLQR